MNVEKKKFEENEEWSSDIEASQMESSKIYL